MLRRPVHHSPSSSLQRPTNQGSHQLSTLPNSQSLLTHSPSQRSRFAGARRDPPSIPSNPQLILAPEHKPAASFRISQPLLLHLVKHRVYRYWIYWHAEKNLGLHGVAVISDRHYSGLCNVMRNC